MNKYIKLIEERKKNQTWSLKYEHCMNCGTTEGRHVARGLCRKCYNSYIEKQHKPHDRKQGIASSIITKEYLEKEYLEKHKSLSDISKDCKCSRQYIHKMIKVFDIPLRNKSSSRRYALRGGKLVFERENKDGQKENIVLQECVYDIDFFKSWTPQMAWVLGVIYTDGNIYIANKNNKHLQIGQKEPELLEKIKALMKCNAKLYYRPKKEYEHTTSGELYLLQIANETIVDDLIQLGVVPNKSLILRFPKIPSEYMRHFIRGCWDGDGCVTIPKPENFIQASFVSGSFDFIKGMKEELKNAGLPEQTIHTVKRKNPSYNIGFSGNQCMLLYQYFYTNVPSEQYLQRKHDIFLNYFDANKRIKSALYVRRLKRLFHPINIDHNI